MALSLALVTSSDNEHGSTVQGTKAYSRNSNAGSGSLLFGSLIALVTRAEGVIVVAIVVVAVAVVAGAGTPVIG